MNRDDPQSETPTENGRDAATLLPAYSLGVTSPEETALVEAALAADPTLAAELDTYTRLRDTLLHSAAPRATSTQLAARLRTATAQDATAQDATAQEQESRADRQGVPPAGQPGWLVVWWQRLLRGSGGWQLAGVAALLLLALLNLYTFGRMDELSQQLIRQEEALRAITTEGAREVVLPAPDAAPGVRATVRWNAERGIAVLHAEALPPLSADQVYQLWLIRNGERTSGGLFSVDARGHGTLIFQPPQPLEGFDALGVTPEPAGGSPGPTAPPVVKGPL